MLARKRAKEAAAKAAAEAEKAAASGGELNSPRIACGLPSSRDANLGRMDEGVAF